MKRSHDAVADEAVEGLTEMILVWQCRGCRRILGDSSSYVEHHPDLRALTLRVSASNNLTIAEPLQTEYGYHLPPPP